MKAFNINGKDYFLAESYDRWTATQYFNDTKDYIKENTAFFQICENDFWTRQSKSALENLALRNYNESYYNTINKLLDDRNYYKLALNIEKYTDCYVLELDFLNAFCGASTSKTIEIDSSFDIDKNFGFIAVKKKDFKNNRKKAYEFMQSIVEEYKKANEICFYQLEVYNDNEEYYASIDEYAYNELTDEQKIKYVLEENGVFLRDLIA